MGSWLGIDVADVIQTGFEVVGQLMPGVVLLAVGSSIAGLAIRRLYWVLVGRPDGVGDSPIVRSPGSGAGGSDK